jgi:integral membrane sensor domain MASE1
MAEEKKIEEFVVNGENLIAKVKELIAEGNVRRIVIKDKSDETLMELPMTVGVVGALLAPILAAIGAVAALVTECKIIVERKD